MTVEKALFLVTTILSLLLGANMFSCLPLKTAKRHWFYTNGQDYSSVEWVWQWQLTWFDAFVGHFAAHVGHFAATIHYFFLSWYQAPNQERQIAENGSKNLYAAA